MDRLRTRRDLLAGIGVATTLGALGALRSARGQDATPATAEPPIAGLIAAATRSFEPVTEPGSIRFSVAEFVDAERAGTGLPALAEEITGTGGLLWKSISYSPLGDQSLAQYLDVSDEGGEGEEVAVFVRVDRFVFGAVASGPDPLGTVEWMLAFIPEDPADELDDAGTADVAFLLPGLEGLPIGYAVLDATPEP